MINVTQDELKKRIHYNPETGDITYLIKGGVASYINKHGYILVSVKNSSYSAQRIAWYYMTGEWPKLMVDHRDRNKLNNRWSNLRLANHKQNECNTGPTKLNTSGYKGVSQDKGRNTWRVSVTVNKKKLWIGSYKTKREAALAYNKAAIDYYGEFAYLNDVTDI